MANDQFKAPATDEDAESVRLVALVDQLLAQARGGVAVDIERVAAEHPELATELRELEVNRQHTATDQPLLGAE
jgi:hypothetical protein